MSGQFIIIFHSEHYKVICRCRCY